MTQYKKLAQPLNFESIRKFLSVARQQIVAHLE